MSKEERRKRLEELCNKFAATYMIIKNIPYSTQQKPILDEIEELFGE